MKKRTVLWTALGAVTLGAAGFAGWMLSLPEPVAARAMPPIAQE